MSRASRREIISKSPSADDCDVQSLHSDAENDVHINSITNVRNSTNSSASNRYSSHSGSENGDQRRSKLTGKSSDRSFSRKLWKVFKGDSSTPPGGKVSPQNDEGPGAVKKAFKRNRNDISMKTFNGGHKDKVSTIKQTDADQFDDDEVADDGRNTTHYANPAYIPSLADEENEHNTSYQGGNKRVVRSYEAPIYSVNSAGRPVPITIEESENEDEDLDYERFDPHDNPRIQTFDSEIPTVPTTFKRNICCFETTLNQTFLEAAREKLITIWRHTYKPDSTGIFVWLCIVTAAFLYNLWTIPLRATYVTEIQSSWKDIWFACDALCDLIFIIDIYIRFRTCYIESGIYVTDLDRLNQRHRKEWRLAFDILAILPTDLLFLHTLNPYFRLNRVLKVHRIFTFYQQGELSTWMPNLWRTLNLVHIFAVIIHYNACFYYALSEANGFGTQLTSWSYPDPKNFPDYAPLYRRYTYSFYWCMVGLGIVNDRYFPETDWQFVFSIYLHLLGMVILVVFIGFVTVLMFGKGSPKFEFEKTIQNTRDYMKQRKLPKELQTRVLRFYQYSWVNQQFPHLDEGNMLRYLPASVRQEIELHSNLTALKQIPSLARCDSSILRDLVMRLRRSMYLPGQFVYRNGDLGTEMYIVGEGILQVIRDTDPSIYSLREGDVFGEIDLFTAKSRKRTADVISYGYSELYVLSSDDVIETLKKYPKFMNMVHLQEKRRRNNVKEYRSFGAKYEALSTTSVRSQADSKISASKVKFRMSSGNFRNSSTQGNSDFSLAHESPDSGMPSTPSMGPSYSSDSGLAMQQDPMKAELAEKISSLYQENMKALKASLDGIWYQEISYLHQRLDDTEQERDMKAREIIQLRRQLARINTSDIARRNVNHVLPVKEKPQLNESTLIKEEDNVAAVASTAVENTTSESQRKVVKSVKKMATAFEAGVQPFGSVSSVENE